MSGKHFHLELLNFEPSEYIVFSEKSMNKMQMKEEWRRQGKGRRGRAGIALSG